MFLKLAIFTVAPQAPDMDNVSAPEAPAPAPQTRPQLTHFFFRFLIKVGPGGPPKGHPPIPYCSREFGTIKFASPFSSVKIAD